MLPIEPMDASRIDEAVAIFHRDGFVAIRDAVAGERLDRLRRAVDDAIAGQVRATPPQDANRGFARYSFGSQMHRPEWAELVDLPAVLPIVQAIWGGSDEFICTGGGGDYSLPGARQQPLHGDLPDVLDDPLGALVARDLPTPFIVVNVPTVDFTELNGAIRFVPGTQRSRARIPGLDQEPEWMRRGLLCAPAGTAIIRDVRCWHGGTANRSDRPRPMASVGYYAPWFRWNLQPGMPRDIHARLSPRAQRLCRYIIAAERAPAPDPAEAAAAMR